MSWWNPVATILGAAGGFGVGVAIGAYGWWGAGLVYIGAVAGAGIRVACIWWL